MLVDGEPTGRVDLQLRSFRLDDVRLRHCRRPHCDDGGFGSTSSYAWDQNLKLTSATSPSGTVGYTYNGAGELATRTTGGSTANMAWDPVGVANPVLVDDKHELVHLRAGRLASNEQTICRHRKR